MDKLLLWCSARHQGSRPSFRQAFAWCTGDDRKEVADRALSNLEVLGHIEVNWDGGGEWAINPPCLALLKGSGGNAVAVGARSPWLRRQLEDRAPFRAVPQDRGPEAWYVSVETTADLIALAAEVGTDPVVDVAGSYAEALPSLDDVIRTARTGEDVGGTEVGRLDSVSLRFEQIPWPRGAWPPGAYEHRGSGPTRYVVRLDDGTCVVVDRRVAVHHELRRLRRTTGEAHFVPLDWRPEGDTLFCDRHAPLPLLQLRTAVLATGLLPKAASLRAHPRQGARAVHAFPGVHILSYKAIARSLDVPLFAGGLHA